MIFRKSTQSYKPGEVRGRWQWQLLGVAIGLFTALAICPRTGWYIKQESRALSHIGPSLSLTRGLDTTVDGTFSQDSELLVRVHAIATTDSDQEDIAVRFAAANLDAQANPEYFRSEILDAQRTRLFPSPEGDKKVDNNYQYIRVLAYRPLFEKYASRPIAVSIYCRALMATGMQLLRPEGYLIRNRYPDGASYGTMLQRTPLAAKLRVAATQGIADDPSNGYFYTVRAIADFMLMHDTEGLTDIDAAATATTWNTYTTEQTVGTEHLKQEVFGKSLPSIQLFRLEWSGAFDSFSLLQNVGYLVTWKAMLLERSGDLAGGLALRSRIAKIGYDYSNVRIPSLYNNPGTFLIRTTIQCPGGVYPPADHKDADRDRVDNERFQTYLRDNGFAKESDWYRMAMNRYFALSHGSNMTLRVSWKDLMQTSLGASMLYFVGFWQLAQLSLVVCFGLVIGAIGYDKRFRKANDAKWSKGTWPAVISGGIVAVTGICILANLESNSQFTRLAVPITLGAVVLLYIVRGREVEGVHFLPFVRSLCCTAITIMTAALIASGFAASNLVYRNALGMGYSPYQQPDNMALLSLVFAITLMTVPMILGYCGVAYARVKYLPLNVALYRCTRKVIVPTIALLIAGYGLTVLKTVSVENLYNRQLSEFIGTDKPLDR